LLSVRGAGETMTLVGGTAGDDGEIDAAVLGAGGWNRASTATVSNTNARTSPNRTRSTANACARIMDRSRARSGRHKYYNKRCATSNR